MQVDKALDAIPDEAYYLRERDGRFYAHTDPTLNRILETIRAGLKPEQIRMELADRARQVVSARAAGTFQVVADVTAPEHIPDQRDRPVLAIIDPLTMTTYSRNAPAATTSAPWWHRLTPRSGIPVVPGSWSAAQSTPAAT